MHVILQFAPLWHVSNYSFFLDISLKVERFLLESRLTELVKIYISLMETELVVVLVEQFVVVVIVVVTLDMHLKLMKRSEHSQYLRK